LIRLTEGIDEMTKDETVRRLILIEGVIELIKNGT
jgi:hypothetical protein